jgi:hypothetical protein
MNKEKLLELADYLDALPPERFDHGTWASHDNECGTAACIAGHQILKDHKQMFHDYLSDAIPGTVFVSRAQADLGLTNAQAGALFYPWNAEGLHQEAYTKLEWANGKYLGAASSTAKQAAYVIRHFVNTGVIDWSVAVCPIKEPTKPTDIPI